MQKRLLNKVSLVTASTDGIGYGIAEKFLKEGSKVMISSRKSKNVNYAVEELTKKYGNEHISGVICDVNKSMDRKKLLESTVDKFGKLDILISNAGTNIHVGNALDIEESAWDKMFDTNLKSGFFLTKDALPFMEKNGAIVYNLSIAAYSPIKMLGVYSIAKTALLGMIKVLSEELASSEKCIRVNGIAPGIIKTKFSQMLHSNQSISEDILRTMHIKRFGTAEDCANLAVFLASDESSYITGETIVVAGGLQSRL